MRKFTVLITTGPTIEFIDPIRFISNRASGKLGYYLGCCAHKDNFKVIMIKGPANLPQSPFKTINVTTTEEMYKQVKKYFNTSDIFISTAAVCDLKPVSPKHQKLKRKKISLDFEPNVDILKEVSKHKKEHQILVGFSVETKNHLKEAVRKLKEKKLDLIISNPPSNIGSDYGEVLMVFKNRKIKKIKRMKKQNLANLIWKEIKRIHESVLHR